MSEEDLTRRKVLSGMAIAGTTGALAGHSTMSLFSDEETFTNNSIRASEAAGGVVEMDVDPGTLSDGSVEFELSLPDIDGRRENPAFICIQAKCPAEDGRFDPDDLRVQLRLKCTNDGDTATEHLLTGSLREVLDILRRGVLLCDDDLSCLTCEDDGPCLEPGDSVTLEFHVIEQLVEGEYGFEIDLTLSALQCRYNDPSGSTLLENTCEGERKCPPADAPGISFIAFCSESGAVLDPSILGTLATNKEEPLSIVWETANPVDYVVVFGGQTWTIYDYRDDGVTTGVATTPPDDSKEEENDVDDPDGIESDGTLGESDIQNTDADLYYDKTDTFVNFEGCSQGSAGSGGSSKGKGTGASEDAGAQSCPCEVASQELTDGPFPSDGTSVKLEYCEDNDVFREGGC